EIEIAPFAAHRRALRIALEDRMLLGRARVFLLLRPHLRGVRLVIPHGVAEVGVQEDIGLVHVARHALAGRDGAGEGVADRVAAFLLAALFAGLDQRAVAAVAVLLAMMIAAAALHQIGDGRVDRRALPVAAILGVGQAVPGFAVVGVDDVAAGAA